MVQDLKKHTNLLLTQTKRIMKKARFIKAFAIAGLALIMSGCSSDKTVKINLLPVQLERNGSWSMINAEGEVVYENEFKEKPTLVINNVFSVKEGEGITVYNAGDKPEPIKGLEGLKSAGMMNEGLIPATAPNSRIALYDDSGNKEFELEPYKGNEIVKADFCYSDGLLTVEDEKGNVGYVDKKGKMVIEPKYYTGSQFIEGYAVVAEKSESDNGESVYKKSVINKKGEAVVSLKSDYELLANAVINGYVIVKDVNDNILFVDMDGEITKCPSKVEQITAIYKDLYIYTSDGSYGAMDYKGESIVRAKYDNLMWDDTNEIFIAKMGDECQILDKKGEKTAETDYKNAMVINGFGIIGELKRTYALIDKEGKQLGKEEFYAISDRFYADGHVESDYFSPDAITEKIAAGVNDMGYDKVKLGGKASNYLSEPVNSSSIYIPELAVNGFRYSINVSILTEEGFTTWNYGSLQWNPDARIQNIMVNLSVKGEWTAKNSENLAKAISKKGFKIIGSNIDDTNSYTAVLQKGDTYIHVSNQTDNIYVSIFDGRVPLIKENIMNSMAYFNNKAAAVTTSQAEAPAADGAAETAAATSGDNPYAWLSEREATATDISGLSKAQLRIMRNAIYARYGMKFKSKDLQEHFARFSWYTPKHDDVSSMLNAIEKKNVRYLKSHE